MNDRVVVYRSESEARQDEFWWSEGYFTATKSGDAILVGIVLVALVFIGAILFNKVSK